MKWNNIIDNKVSPYTLYTLRDAILSMNNMDKIEPNVILILTRNINLSSSQAPHEIALSSAPSQGKIVVIVLTYGAGQTFFVD